jgi:2-polyprenyl-6-hydroxyphenyl methylase / 3-demethylubiquinone-9 3-methyltransferase
MFDQQAKDWWDLQGPAKGLHTTHPLRLLLLKSYVELADKQVLDIGCGGGIMTEMLARSGAKATGIDAETAMIDIAKAHQGELKINYQAAKLADFAKTKKTFDVITAYEVIEHVSDPAAFLEQCDQLLKPGGQIWLSTIDRTLKSFLLVIVAAEYLINLIPKGTHEYQKFIRPSELIALAEQQKWQVLTTKGYTYNPFNNSAKLCNNLNPNYIVGFQKNT